MLPRFLNKVLSMSVRVVPTIREIHAGRGVPDMAMKLLINSTLHKVVMHKDWPWIFHDNESLLLGIISIVYASRTPYGERRSSKRGWDDVALSTVSEWHG
jgi:hypothetical protein